MANPFAGITTAARAPAAPVVDVPAVAVEPPRAPPAVPPQEPREPVYHATAMREYLGFRLSTALADRARAVAWTQRQSLTAYVVAAIEAAVTAAERANGGPFPPVTRRSRGG